MSLVLKKRFAELSEQLAAVERTRKSAEVDGLFVGQFHVDRERLLNWSVKVRSLLVAACGKDSEHYAAFVRSEQGSTYDTNHTTMTRLRGVFEAAREDFEGGYLIKIRSLVQAEIAGSELDQARELLSAGYITAAGVVAGVVLENALRELCARNHITPGSADRMNADLAKAAHYNALVQKRVLGLIAVRNSAAHGKVGEFSAKDVESMVAEVERFVTDYLV